VEKLNKQKTFIMNIAVKSIIIIMTFALTTLSFGQTNKIIIQTNINLPKDTLVTNNLIKSLNGFLSLKEKPNKENTFVLNEDLLETSILIDEMKGIEKSGKYKDDNFYKGYLTNVAPINKTDFLIQFSYIGVFESTPILVASYEIMGKLRDNKFYFCSPLKRNTASWQNKKNGNYVFHFKNSLNEKVVSEYIKNVQYFDKKLNAQNKKIEWYGCNDLPELLQIIGVNYKLDYNSQNATTFSAIENNSLLIVSGENNTGFDAFDPHDLWHDRLHNVISTSIINKPVDEGCAYLYGGSWGIGWTQILKTFKEKVSSNPKSDWLSLYEQFYNFGESKEKHLLVSYVINALIVQKIEKEKGFASVIELLSCGKYEKTNEKYFATLDKLTGINKNNFNDNIWALIKKSN
jgi:hypothetical protein